MNEDTHIIGTELCDIVYRYTQPYVESFGPHIEYSCIMCEFGIPVHCVTLQGMQKISKHDISSCINELCELTDMNWYCTVNVSNCFISYTSQAGNSVPKYIEKFLLDASSLVQIEPYRVLLPSTNQQIITPAVLEELNTLHGDDNIIWMIINRGGKYYLVASKEQFCSVEKITTKIALTQMIWPFLLGIFLFLFIYEYKLKYL